MVAEEALGSAAMSQGVSASLSGRIVLSCE